MFRFPHCAEQLLEKAFNIEQKRIIFAELVGDAPGLFQASHELVFTDPRDDAYIPRIAGVKKRFPSLAALRAKKVSVAPEYAVRAEHLGVADDGCHPHIFVGPIKQKYEVERAANTSGL